MSTLFDMILNAAMGKSAEDINAEAADKICFQVGQARHERALPKRFVDFSRSGSPLLKSKMGPEFEVDLHIGVDQGGRILFEIVFGEAGTVNIILDDEPIVNGVMHLWVRTIMEVFAVANVEVAQAHERSTEQGRLKLASSRQVFLDMATKAVSAEAKRYAGNCMLHITTDVGFFNANVPAMGAM